MKISLFSLKAELGFRFPKTSVLMDRDLNSVNSILPPEQIRHLISSFFLLLSFATSLGFVEFECS